MTHAAYLILDMPMGYKCALLCRTAPKGEAFEFLVVGCPLVT